MPQTHETSTTSSSQRVILIGVKLKTALMTEIEDSLEELKQLTQTAGMETVCEIVQSRETLHPAYFIGQGKVEELKLLVQELRAYAVVFDEDLTPAQTRNIERALDVVAIDRTGLILQIFAQRAQTREATLQVDLARLEYALPRLTRMWSHLSRQTTGGGSGGRFSGAARGEGETQLQTDRRLIRREIARVKKALGSVEKQRRIQRKSREDMANVSLVGYTNAGKSTLFNRLTGAKQLTEDKLFATLDSTTRSVPLTDNHGIVLTDTVGFIKKLPHHLIAAFRATLEEICDAKLILHVVDVSHPQAEAQIDAVNEVLDELSAARITTLMLFNKVDCLEDEARLCLLQNQYPESVAISARHGDGLEKLKAQLVDRCAENRQEVWFTLPYTEGKTLDFLYKNGEVLETDYQGDAVLVKARIAQRFLQKLRQFVSQS